MICNLEILCSVWSEEDDFCECVCVYSIVQDRIKIIGMGSILLCFVYSNACSN